MHGYIGSGGEGQLVVPAGLTTPLFQVAGVALLVDVCGAVPVLVHRTLEPALIVSGAGEKTYGAPPPLSVMLTFTTGPAAGGGGGGAGGGVGEDDVEPEPQAATNASTNL